MNDTFMKEKPVGPLLASMALPMVFSMLVNSLYNIVDSFFVAQISEQAMTALSLVYPVQNMINAVAIGFGIGINARVSYHLGAGDQENGRHRSNPRLSPVCDPRYPDDRDQYCCYACIPSNVHAG